MKKPKFIITKHAMERYADRINFNQKRVKDAIIKDLKALKNKRIITVADKKYVFYKNYREFVIKQDGDKEILITVIKHKRSTKEKAIQKRLKEKEEYESIIRDFENYKKDED